MPGSDIVSLATERQLDENRRKEQKQQQKGKNSVQCSALGVVVAAEIGVGNDGVPALGFDLATHNHCLKQGQVCVVIPDRGRLSRKSTSRWHVVG